MIGQVVGQYRITQLLGEGGMGAVWEGVHDQIHRHAAIKILKLEVSNHRDAETRFFNEARAVNIIDHPSIVQIYDVGHLPDGRGYLVMEVLRGELLSRRLARIKRMSPSDAMRLGRQIAAALAAAHAKQIVHRDLKPDNLMIVPDPEAAGGERVKVLDFGIAKLKLGASDPTLQNADSPSLSGTPTFMSPEQCRGHAVDGRSDVYSLGVILYLLIAGRVPFVGDNALAIMFQHTAEPPPPLRTFSPQTPDDLAQLIEAMLAKEPTQRPTMFQVEQELTRIAAAASAPAAAPMPRAVATMMEAVSVPTPQVAIAPTPQPRPGPARPAARPAPTPPAVASATVDVPRAWWFWDNLDAAEIQPRLASVGARPARIAQFVWRNARRFCVVGVQDAAPAWWWLIGVDAATVSAKIAELGARVADQDSFFDGAVRRYQVVLVKDASGAPSWWYPSLDGNGVEQKLREHGARVADLDAWVEGVQPRFSVTLVPSGGEPAPWYPAIDVAQIGHKLGETGTRPVALEQYANGPLRAFSMATVRNTTETWWYQVGVDAAGLQRFAQDNGAWIVDVDPFVEPGDQLRFSAILYKKR